MAQCYHSAAGRFNDGAKAHDPDPSQFWRHYQINVFTVPPDGQQALIDHLSKAAAYARQEPVWLSANLHRSLDGTRVVNYAQSESLEAAHAVIDRLKAGGFIDRNRTFGEAHPGPYEVVATFER